MDPDYLESMINELDRKVRDLLDRVDRAEREARRLEDRIRYLEMDR